MGIIKWYSIYSVNNEVIDGQHKMLFNTFNRLYDKCIGNDEIDYALALDDLLTYSEQHMSSEEQYMKEIGYADIDAHIEMHKEFARKVSRLNRMNVDQDNDRCRELIVLLGNWLLSHEIEEDKKFVGQEVVF